ncbi:MAG TPA: hypothetical protein PK402_05425 [Tepidisphaeraceae bacterium]|nr:hypothetical protein [Tepidisphaeraceae bacterium]
MSSSSTTIETPPEAFGQASAGKYVMSVFVILSMICSGVSLAMWRRSHNLSDVFYKDTPTGMVEIRSVYGRLILTRSHFEEPSGVPQGNDWNYMRRDVPDTIRDGWRPGFWKTVGFQQGVDLNPQQGVSQQHWLRIRWPTLAVITAVLPVGYVLMRGRREREQEEFEEELALR